MRSHFISNSPCIFFDMRLQKILVGVELFSLTLVAVSCLVELAVSIRILVVLGKATCPRVASWRRLCPRCWGWCFDQVKVNISRHKVTTLFHDKVELLFVTMSSYVNSQITRIITFASQICGVSSQIPCGST